LDIKGTHRNNPLKDILDDRFNQGDYRTYHSYLRLPLPYLVLLFKNYARPHEAVYNLPRVLEKFHRHLWEKLKMERDVSFIEKQWAAVGIPVTFFKNRLAICNRRTDQDDYEFLLNHVKAFVEQGKSLYLHSDQLDGALIAGTAILKKALEAKIPNCFCISYPNVVDAKKSSWEHNDSASGILDRVSDAALLVLYAVGSEYEGTGYSVNMLLGMLEDRAVNRKPTIVVSGLTPQEFLARYKRDPDGVCIGFTDTKIKETLKDLRKALSK
jgi:DNA replication protein DnaC